MENTTEHSKQDDPNSVQTQNERQSLGSTLPPERYTHTNRVAGQNAPGDPATSRETAMFANPEQTPLLDETDYPDATGSIIRTAYPGQDGAIDDTTQQSQTGANSELFERNASDAASETP